MVAPAKRAYQFFGENAKAYNSREPEILLAGPAGCGKAQPHSEPVMTPDGPVPMGLLAVGDQVLTPTGTARVQGVYPQGECDVYRVRFSCGRVVRCTADHLWTVWRYVGSAGKGAGVRPESFTVTTRDLIGHLTSGRRNPRLRYWVEPPVPAAMRERPVPIPAYVLGVWLGDGSPIGPNRSLQFTTADPEMAECVRAELTDGHSLSKQRSAALGYIITHPSQMHASSYKARAYIRHNGHSFTLVVRTLNKSRYVGSYPTREEADRVFRDQPECAAPPPLAPYRKRLVDMGLGGCRSHEKFVPAVYKYNSAAVRLAVVQGLMDTDGTVDRASGMPSYCTNSRRLARDFRFLVESLGGGVTIRAKRTKCRVAFNCYVRFDDPAALFRLGRKKALCKPREKYPFRRWIESIRHEGREECRCISVDDPARLYLTRGFVPTHNTVVLLAKCLTLLGKYPGCRGLFCRGTRASLTQSGLVTWEQDVLGETHPILVRSPCKRRVRQSYEFPNKSELVVAGLDDPGKTLSAQYDFVYIQEATEEGVTFDTYDTLLRLMRNGRMPYAQIMSDCNPTTPTHWLYKRQAKRLLRMYSSTHHDNPRFWDREKRDWTAAGRDYVEGTLRRMTGARLARFYYGDWKAAEGLVFDGFVPRRCDERENPGHLMPEGWRPPADWARVWSIDWGFTSPLVLQFWAVDGDGRMYLYREYYHTQIRAEAVGEWARAEIESGREPVPRAVVCDHDPLMKAEFEKGSGLPLELADKKDLMAGIQVVQGRFDRAGDGRPRLFVADNCVHRTDPRLSDAGRPCSFQEELGAYIWDTNSVIERPLDKDNHGADACRYAVRWAEANLCTPTDDYTPGADAEPLLPGEYGRIA